MRFSTLVKMPLSESLKLLFWLTETKALRLGSSGVVSSVAILNEPTAPLEPNLGDSGCRSLTA